MGWESFGVLMFDLGPLLQGQARIAKLKRAYNSLIIKRTVRDAYICFHLSSTDHHHRRRIMVSLE